jgi:uncharacterized protein (DUF4415 family)
MKTVRMALDDLPPLTADQQSRLAALAAMPDTQIDTGDIPEMTDAAMASMSRGRFYRPVKQQITARVDADVLAWLKSQGKGYQALMNAILRREMLKRLEMPLADDLKKRA